ncbi:MAG: SufD family Fe-S cluster assembly protein [Vampirovibrionales bacterium]
MMMIVASQASEPSLLATPNPKRVTVQAQPLTSPLMQHLLPLVEANAPAVAVRLQAVGEPQPRRHERFKYVDVRRLLATPALPVRQLEDSAHWNHGLLQPMNRPCVPANGVETMDDPFALLALGLSTTPLELRLPNHGEPLHPIELTCNLNEEAIYPIALQADLQAGSQATVWVNLQQSTLTNNTLVLGLVDANLAEGSQLTVIVTGNVQANTHVYFTTQGDVHATAQLTVISLGLQAGTFRHSMQANLLGEGADAQCNGLLLANEAMQGHHHIQINHRVPNCTSGQLFKTIATDTAKCEFDGSIYVAPHAIETDAQQLSNTLLLSNKAKVYNRPWLQIDADDVKCSHGATVGQLDAQQLFYLKSRGIDETTATALLMHAFAYQVLESLASAVPEVHAQVQPWVEDRLSQFFCVKDGCGA